MNNLALTLLAVIGISTITFSQVVSIEIGSSGDISGTQYNVTAGSGEIHLSATVASLVTDSMDLQITRDRIISYPSWEDHFCWGIVGDPFGACYGFQPTNPWTSPQSDTVRFGLGISGILDIYIKPLDPDFGCGVYRYRIMHGAIAIDSLDIGICKTSELDEEMNKIHVAAFPNPASETLFIDLTSSSSSHVSMFNLLGHQVLTRIEITGKTEIDVREFDNGIYFIRVVSANGKTIIKKVIIEHG